MSLVINLDSRDICSNWFFSWGAHFILHTITHLRYSLRLSIINIWDIGSTNSWGQGVTWNLTDLTSHRDGITTEISGIEDTFLTCYKSRPIHPIMTQIGAGKQENISKLTNKNIWIFMLRISQMTPSIQIFNSDRSRGLSVIFSS